MAEPTTDLATAHATLFAAGHARRTAVLGAAHASAAPSAYAKPMIDLATEAAWGSIWTRPGLSPKTRSLLNVAMLVALGRSAELALHAGGAMENGAGEGEVREAVMQAGVYCGIPAGMEGIRVTDKAIDEWAKAKGLARPIKGKDERGQEPEEVVRDVGVEERMNTAVL